MLFKKKPKMLVMKIFIISAIVWFSLHVLNLSPCWILSKNLKEGNANADINQTFCIFTLAKLRLSKTGKIP